MIISELQELLAGYSPDTVVKVAIPAGETMFAVAMVVQVIDGGTEDRPVATVIGRRVQVYDAETADEVEMGMVITDVNNFPYDVEQETPWRDH